MSTEAARPASLGLRERHRLAVTIWFATLWAALVAVSLPWYLRLLPIDLGPPAWTAFGLGALLWVASLTTDRLDDRQILATFTTVHLAGIAVLGVLWQLAGGLENLAFLVVFAFPVVAAGAMPVRSLRYLSAVTGWLVVVLLALTELPELRWTLASAGLPSWLSSPSWPQPVLPVNPFPAVTPDPGTALATLLLFGALLAGVGFVVDSLSGHLARLYRRLESTGAERARAESMALELIGSSPEPALLLRHSNLQIVAASDSFFARLLVDREEIFEKSVLDVVAFAYPEIAEGLLRGERDDVPYVALRVGDETLFARVQSYPLASGSEQLIFATLHDAGQETMLQAALDAADEELLDLSVDDRVVYFNRTASELLGPLELGQAAADALAGCALDRVWWHPGPRSRVERRVQAGERPCRSSITSVPVAGSDGELLIVRLRPEEVTA